MIVENLTIRYKIRGPTLAFRQTGTQVKPKVQSIYAVQQTLINRLSHEKNPLNRQTLGKSTREVIVTLGDFSDRVVLQRSFRHFSCPWCYSGIFVNKFSMCLVLQRLFRQKPVQNRQNKNLSLSGIPPCTGGGCQKFSV